MRIETTPGMLADCRRGYLIAPAGCGKTHLIAQAVASSSGGRQLILTHTHAGVHSLNQKLRRMGVGLRQVRVETIASWCLRYAAAFSSLSGIDNMRPAGAAWNTVYDGALDVLRR
jgi:DNA helicase-2/ATP-dependent DNA helicase PcrA